VHRDLFSEMPAAWTLWFKAFIGVALTEEMLKFLVVYFLYFKQPFFDEPMDGIVYCVLVGMGFVSVENFFMRSDLVLNQYLFGCFLRYRCTWLLA